MTLSEKAAQVIMNGIDGNERFSPYLLDHFRGVVPGAILLFGYNIAPTPERTAAYVDSCAKSFRSLGGDIPVMFAIDDEGGEVFRTRGVTSYLPSARDIAGKLSPKDAESLYFSLGNQLRYLGITMNLAPVAEIPTDLNVGFLDSRLFSADGTVTDSFSRAASRGYSRSGIVPVLKHFPGSGDADPHSGFPKIDATREDIIRRYGAPFSSISGDWPAAILVSHSLVPSVDTVPFCLSFAGVTGILRDELGFDGVAITDDISMDAIRRAGWSSGEAAVAAISAGCDMVMTSDTDIRSVARAIETAAKDDPLFAARLDESVVRILTLKIRVGLVKTALRRYSDSRSGSGKKAAFNLSSFTEWKARAERTLREGSGNE